MAFATSAVDTDAHSAADPLFEAQWQRQPLRAAATSLIFCLLPSRLWRMADRRTSLNAALLITWAGIVWLICLSLLRLLELCDPIRHANPGVAPVSWRYWLVWPALLQVRDVRFADLAAVSPILLAATAAMIAPRYFHVVPRSQHLRLAVHAWSAYWLSWVVISAVVIAARWSGAELGRHEAVMFALGALPLAMALRVLSTGYTTYLQLNRGRIAAAALLALCIPAAILSSILLDGLPR